MGREKVCSFCGSPTHSSFNCYSKRRSGFDSTGNYKKLKQKQKKHLRPESKKHNSKRAVLSNTWHILNPPDYRGGYTCYLQISKNCPKWMAKAYTTLEHVYPKNKYPELRWNVLNIKPACEWCNAEKLSNTVYQLAVIYPHIVTMIAAPEWQAWEAQIAPFIKPELH